MHSDARFEMMNGHGLTRIVTAFAWLLAMLPVLVVAEDLKWSQLAPLPDREGFAGMYAGVSGDGLLAAGGANFPDKKPWEGGTKAWYDTVWRLDSPEAKWRAVGKLPSARGYGLSITIDDGVLCIGGADADKHHAECFVLSWHNDGLQTKPMPALPQPCANITGARLGDTIYVAGGLAEPTATSTMATFWVLDLKHVGDGWKSLPSWPGRPRMLAIGAASGGSFFIAGGADLHAGADGKPVRTYLTDGFRFTPGEGWTPIAALPAGCVAPPTPSPATADGFLVLGGDDGANVNFEPKTQHPGFLHTLLAYDVAKDVWSKRADLPFANVTNPATLWRGAIIVVSGEQRPGVRSPAMWSGR